MGENRIANALKIVGVIEATCGLVVGLVAAYNGSGIIGITIILGGLLTCLMFMGFAEIIQLLQTIADKHDVLVMNTINTGSKHAESTNTGNTNVHRANVAPAVTYDDLPDL